MGAKGMQVAFYLPTNNRLYAQRPYSFSKIRQMHVGGYLLKDKMSKGLTGNQNGNWRGGRLIASNGYILVRVGTNHHLADIRGYAYEHRLVAEQILGRDLSLGEIVHHLDGNRTNNVPENIEIAGSIAEHLFLHRHNLRSERRKPYENNPIVNCQCGCGEEFLKYDAHGRPRKYILGHNPQSSPEADAILSLLTTKGITSRQHIAIECDKTIRQIAVALSKLKKQGLIQQKGRGLWAIK
jgi:hypothetical protein